MSTASAKSISYSGFVRRFHSSLFFTVGDDCIKRSVDGLSGNGVPTVDGFVAAHIRTNKNSNNTPMIADHTQQNTTACVTKNDRDKFKKSAIGAVLSTGLCVVGRYLWKFIRYRCNRRGINPTSSSCVLGREEVELESLVNFNGDGMENRQLARQVCMTLQKIVVHGKLNPGRSTQQARSQKNFGMFTSCSKKLQMKFLLPLDWPRA
ncbi:unnamed protein product [Allacma fusca]|uniref:Uncharacterized protein n=1 Tax=Allacma fusca TaxID=39272 RepID=A0A8J2P166_9HEXA|nr:unnamed protein product [Allacma fusca]